MKLRPVMVVLLSAACLARSAGAGPFWYSLADAMREVLERADSQGFRPELVELESCPNHDHFAVEMRAAVPVWQLAEHLKLSPELPEVSTMGSAKRVRFVTPRAVDPPFAVGARYGMPRDWQALSELPGAAKGRLSLPPRRPDGQLPTNGPFEFELEASTVVALTVLARASDRLGVQLTSVTLSEPGTPRSRLILKGAASRLACPGPVPIPEPDPAPEPSRSRPPDAGSSPGQPASESGPSEPAAPPDSWIGF